MKAITDIFKNTTVHELEDAKATALLHLETAKDAVADARMGIRIEHFLKEKEKIPMTMTKRQFIFFVVQEKDKTKNLCSVDWDGDVDEETANVQHNTTKQ